jgi:recombination protein RecT
MANEVAKISPIQEVRETLTKMEPQFKMALPAHIQPEKFMRVVMTALQNDPKLVTECSRSSLYNACMQAAQDGLIPDKREGVILPFKSEAKWMPMVGGICKKARNSGEISTIDAQVVYEKDTYEAWIDDKGQHFKHVKSREADRGPVVLTYAYAITKDGGFYFEEIDETQMSAIEKMSKANDGPWKGPFRDEMRRKSALRRLTKYRLPSSTDLEVVVERDNDFYDLEKKDQPKDSGPSRLRKAMGVSDLPSSKSTEQPT